MKSTTLASLATAAGLATAKPLVENRSTELCGQWDSLQIGNYIVYNNLWGESAATSGSQCTTVEDSTEPIAWSTSWSWEGGPYNVKSFANAVVSPWTATQLSSLTSLATTWSWSYSGGGDSMVADVAYDLFTSSTADGATDDYEIMIWLAAIGGAGPISSTGSTIATPEIDGTTWNLYSGYNGDMMVFSFVAPSEVTDFSGDLVDFITYLTSNQGMDASQYLVSIGAGTEPFVGDSAVMTTTAYSVTV